MKLLKDYDCTIEYDPGKANVAADALNRKSTGNWSYIHTVKLPLLVKLRKLGVDISITASEGILSTLRVRLLLIERIKQTQKVDSEAKWLHKEIKIGKKKQVICDDNGVLKFGKRIFIPNIEGLKKEILEEEHCSGYAMHPGNPKM